MFNIEAFSFLLAKLVTIRMLPQGTNTGIPAISERKQHGHPL
jgi:hypothetical protein